MPSSLTKIGRPAPPTGAGSRAATPFLLLQAEFGQAPLRVEAALPAGRPSSAVAIQREQFAEQVVIGDIGRPAVGGGHGGVERDVRVGEPLRPGVVEVC